MSLSISTKVLLFSGLLSLLQISTNLMGPAQVSAVSLTCGTGMSKCKTPLVLETSEENAQDSQENAQDSQENAQDSDENAEYGGKGGLNFSARERAYLLKNHLLIDLSLKFLDGSRLSMPEAGQNAAFEIAEDGVQETSAASTLVHAQRWKTVGDLKTWLASVRGKSIFLIDVFLFGTEMQLEDTQTLSQIGDEFIASSEASNNTGPVILFVLERAFSKDDLVQDFLEQYSTRLNNFPEIESSTASAVVQKNEMTVRIERDDIDTNTKTSSDKDSSPFYEFTFVQERTNRFRTVMNCNFECHRERTRVDERRYIVFRGSTGISIYYDVSIDSWLHCTTYPFFCEEVNDDVSFRNNIGFRAKKIAYDRDGIAIECALKIADLGEMTWAKLFTTYLFYGSFESSPHIGSYSFPDHAKELLIPEWEDFAIEFYNESAGAPSLHRGPIPDSQRLITKTGAGNVKIYDSDRQYFEKVEEKVGENWEGLRIADVTFKQNKYRLGCRS